MGVGGRRESRESTKDNLILEFELNETDPPLYPIELIVGLSRPQTNRRILREATSLGVRRLSFVQTDEANLPMWNRDSGVQENGRGMS